MKKITIENVSTALTRSGILLTCYFKLYSTVFFFFCSTTKIITGNSRWYLIIILPIDTIIILMFRYNFYRHKRSEHNLPVCCTISRVHQSGFFFYYFLLYIKRFKISIAIRFKIFIYNREEEEKAVFLTGTATANLSELKKKKIPFLIIFYTCAFRKISSWTATYTPTCIEIVDVIFFFPNIIGINIPYIGIAAELLIVKIATFRIQVLF